MVKTLKGFVYTYLKKILSRSCSVHFTELDMYIGTYNNKLLIMHIIYKCLQKYIMGRAVKFSFIYLQILYINLYRRYVIFYPDNHY